MKRLLPVLALAVAVAAGVGIGLATKSSGATRRATTIRHPAATSIRRAAATPAESAARGRARSCVGERTLAAGAAVPAWRMGAIQFLTARVGVGLTAGAYLCQHRTASDDNSVTVAAAPQLALTDDGGRHWFVTGAPIPDQPPVTFGVIEQVLATSPAVVTVLDSRGRVFATGDGGESWRQQTLPAPVIQIAAAGNHQFALITRGLGRSARTIVERSTDGTERWRRLRLPRSVAYAEQVALTTLSPGDLLIDSGGFSNGDGGLYLSDDDGDHWSRLTFPSWHGNDCADAYSQIAAASPTRWWMLCDGGAAAGSDAKGLLKTDDAGRTWHVISAVTSLTGPVHPSAIPASQEVALATGSAARLWLSLLNGLAESADGGVRWQSLKQIDPDGSLTTFDVLNAHTAWLLAPGTGLWHTTDGGRWAAIGPLNPL